MLLNIYSDLKTMYLTSNTLSYIIPGYELNSRDRKKALVSFSVDIIIEKDLYCEI